MSKAVIDMLTMLIFLGPFAILTVVAMWPIVRDDIKRAIKMSHEIDMTRDEVASRTKLN